MAVQIINDPGRSSYAGQLFGQSLSNALGALAQSKLNQMAQQDQERTGIRRLESLGVDPNWASYINSLPAKQQYEALQNYAQVVSQNQPNQQLQQQFQPNQPLQQLSNELSNIQPSKIEELSQLLSPQKRTAADLLSSNSSVSDILRQALSKSQIPQQVKIQPQEPSQQQVLAQQQPMTPDVMAPKTPQPRQPALTRPVRIEDFAGTTSPAKNLAQLSLEEKKKSNLFKRNEPYIKQAEKAYESAQNIRSTAQQMLDLLETGNVAEGTSLRRVLPDILQSNETQQFKASAEELATALASQLGVPTRDKIQLARNQKPNIQLSKSVNENLLRRIIEKTEKPIRKWDILKEIELEDNPPEDIRKEVLKRERSYDLGQPEEQVAPSSLKVGQKFSSLDDILKSVPEKTKFSNNGRLFQKINGRAVEVR